MSEEPVEPGTDPNPDPAVTSNGDAPVEDQRVPYDRFKQVNDEKAALAQQVEELAAWKRDQEQAQLSEQEKLQQAAAEATARAEAAEMRALTLERSQWVTAAARAAGFADPADAALAVNLGEVEDAAAAQTAVEKLAAAKPHWLTQAKPSGFGHIGEQPRRGSEPPLDADGKPDLKAGLGQDLARHLLG